MAEHVNDRNYYDRDVIFDNKGDIYQVMGSIHPADVVLVTPKYHKITTPEPNQFYWQRKNTPDLYQRILPQYDAQTVAKSITENTYRHFSSIFQCDIIQIPRNQIKEHLSPKKRLQELFSSFRNGPYSEKQKLDAFERTTLDVASIFMDEFSLSESDLGISGSILWGGQHSKSDIDFTIYGLDAKTQFLMKAKTFQSQPKGLREFSLLELMSKAEKWAEKSGLSVEECFDYLHQKKYLFYFKDRFISLTFVPKPEELLTFSPYILETKFLSIGPATIRAKILSDKWGLYYPGLYQIQCESIDSINKDTISSANEITRLLIYEHENVGYYSNGDLVEIAGLLQKCERIPIGSGFDIGTTYQIVVGTKETYQHEFVRKI